MRTNLKLSIAAAMFLSAASVNATECIELGPFKAKVEVRNGGTTLSINGYENPWFVSEGQDKKILPQIKEAMHRPNITEIILDTRLRYTPLQLFAEFSEELLSNQNIKSLILPTLNGNKHTMETQVVPIYLDIFKKNQGLKITVGENRPNFDHVTVTFFVP